MRWLRQDTSGLGLGAQAPQGRYLDCTPLNHRRTTGAEKLVSKAIKTAKVVGFADLGMEAIYEFEVVDMPVTVAVDSGGTSAHLTGPAEWEKKIATRQFKNIALTAG